MHSIRETTDNEVHDSGNGSKMRTIPGLSAPLIPSAADLDAALALGVLVVSESGLRALNNGMTHGRGLGKRIEKAAA